MNEPIQITRQMLDQLGVELDDILGPGIELEHLTFSTEGEISLGIVGLGEDAPQPELGELKANQLIARLGERLGDDWNPVNFNLNSATIDGKKLDIPEGE